MNRFRPLVSTLMTSVLLAGCGVQQLPPPQAPAREAPQGVEVPPEPPAAGTGRVVFDTNGEKARIIEITGAATTSIGGYQATTVGVRHLCTTPCVVDLSYGTHPLALRSLSDPTRQSETDIEVGSRPKIFRHNLGKRTSSGGVGVLGSTLVGLGAVAALTGAILWGVGGASNSSSSLESTGQTITLAGVGGMVVGIPLMILDRPTEQPGSTTEWTLKDETPERPSTAPPAGGGARL